MLEQNSNEACKNFWSGCLRRDNCSISFVLKKFLQHDRLPCLIGKHGIESCLVLPRNEVEQNLLKASATKFHDAYQTAFGRCSPDLRTVA